MPNAFKQSFQATCRDAWKTMMEGKKKESLEFLLERINCSPPIEKTSLKTCYNVIYAMPDQETLCRDIIGSFNEEVSISSNANTGKIAVVFPALGKDVTTPLQSIDAFLADAGYSTIFIRDKSHMLSANGISALGENRLSTQNALNELINQFNSESVIYIGMSGGGYTALLYGIEQNIKKIVTFSPPTGLTPLCCTKAGDERAPKLAKKLRNILTEEEMDIKKILQKNCPQNEIHIHYSQNMPIDQIHAKHLDVFHNVYLHNIFDFSAHETFRYYMINRNLQEILD